MASCSSARPVSARPGPSSASTRRATGTGTAAAKSRLSRSAGSRPRSSAGESSAASFAGGPPWPCPLLFPFSGGLLIASRSMSMLVNSVIPSTPPPIHVDVSQILHPDRRLLDAVHRQDELDRPETLGLVRAHDAQADQLQQREEGDDHLGAVRIGGEQAREVDLPREREARQGARHGLLPRDRLPPDLL